MPRFEIIYSDEPTSEALLSESIVARDRTEAARKAHTDFGSAQLTSGARCYRVVDGHGMVVARGPTTRRMAIE